MKKNFSLFQWYDTLQRRLLSNTQEALCPGETFEAANAEAQASWSSDFLRAYLLRHLQDLELTAPFSWRAYLDTMKRAYEQTHPHVRIEITRTHLPQGTFAQWIMSVYPVTDSREYGMDGPKQRRRQEVSAQLLVAQSSDEAIVERSVYHEVGHLELGHLLLADAPVFAAPRVTRDAGHEADERDAEHFATILQRLAHGWDPAALLAPRLDSFFHVMG